MLTHFDEIIERVLEHEGGYVDDPNDLGGETNFGITKRFYPDVDIKNLTKEDAKQIYYDDYWLKNKVNKMPPELKYIYFDMCINMGKRTAIRILQGASIGMGKDIALDGGLGANTFKAIQDLEVERVIELSIMLILLTRNLNRKNSIMAGSGVHYKYKGNNGYIKGSINR